MISSIEYPEVMIVAKLNFREHLKYACQKRQKRILAERNIAGGFILVGVIATTCVVGGACNFIENEAGGLGLPADGTEN